MKFGHSVQTFTATLHPTEQVHSANAAVLVPLLAVKPTFTVCFSMLLLIHCFSSSWIQEWFVYFSYPILSEKGTTLFKTDRTVSCTEVAF